MFPLSVATGTDIASGMIGRPFYASVRPLVDVVYDEMDQANSLPVVPEDDSRIQSQIY